MPFDRVSVPGVLLTRYAVTLCCYLVGLINCHPMYRGLMVMMVGISGRSGSMPGEWGHA